MRLIQRLSIGAALVLLMNVGIAAVGDHWTVEHIPFDDIFDFPCLGEPVHVVGEFTFQVHSWTDGGGKIHADVFIDAAVADAVGVVTGDVYRYTSTFKNQFHGDSDFAPANVVATSRFVLAAPSGGTTLTLRMVTHVAVNADGTLTTDVFRSADTCHR